MRGRLKEPFAITGALVALTSGTGSRCYDIGGTETLTYGELVAACAEVADLGRL